MSIKADVIFFFILHKKKITYVYNHVRRTDLEECLFESKIFFNTLLKFGTTLHL